MGKVNHQTDHQLLRAYAEQRSEPAFAELVRRHVDWVHSAALRMVRDAHLAQDVTQGVFVALAKNAAQLADRPVLAGWLHRTTRNIAAQTIRTDVRRRAREQEAAAMNELLASQPEAVWGHVALLLDDALGELSEPDRDAVLLRYFERKSAREMAQTLGVSDEAAQRRVSRAVERLREFFARRGVTVGASGLALSLTANAVQAAPAGLAVTVSTAAALAGTTFATTATATATKAIAMTTFQKLAVGAALAATIATGAYQTRQLALVRADVDATRDRQQLDIQALVAERESMARQLTALRADNDRLYQSTLELARLRGEVTRMRREAEVAAGRLASNQIILTLDRLQMEAATKAERLKEYIRSHPEKASPEFQFLDDVDWLRAMDPSSAFSALESELHFDQALSSLRLIAEIQFRRRLSAGLIKFHEEAQRSSPATMEELKPFLDAAVVQVLGEHWQEMKVSDPGAFKGGSLSDRQGDWAIVRNSELNSVGQRVAFVPVKGAGLAPVFAVCYFDKRHLPSKPATN